MQRESDRFKVTFTIESNLTLGQPAARSVGVAYAVAVG